VSVLLIVSHSVHMLMGVTRKSYAKDMPFSRLLEDAICLPLFDGGNLGVRRRQMEKILKSPDYQPWAGVYGTE
jgi:nitroalkane oxidase